MIIILWGIEKTEAAQNFAILYIEDDLRTFIPKRHQMKQVCVSCDRMRLALWLRMCKGSAFDLIVIPRQQQQFMIEFFVHDIIANY